MVELPRRASPRTNNKHRFMIQTVLPQGYPAAPGFIWRVILHTATSSTKPVRNSGRHCVLARAARKVWTQGTRS